MTLKVNDVAFVIFIFSAEEVVEPDLVQGGGRSVGRDVSADAALFTVGAHNHGERVPTHETSNSAFNFAVTRIDRLPVSGNGIDVWSVGGEWDLNPRFLSVTMQFGQESVDPLRPPMADDIIQGIQPFATFNFIKVRSFLANDSLHFPKSGMQG